MALLIGLVGAAIAVVPALFIQGVFIGSAQRCQEQRTFEQAAYDEVRTTCAKDLYDVPLWLPAATVAGGAVMGVSGGFAYGFINPARYRREQEPPWLPF